MGQMSNDHRYPEEVRADAIAYALEKEMRRLIPQISDRGILDVAIGFEQQGENRPPVLKAIRARIRELEACVAR